MLINTKRKLRWFLDSPILNLLLLTIMFGIVIFTFLSRERVMIKNQTGIYPKEKVIQRQAVTYSLPSSLESNINPESFELEVASEVKRICSDVYPDLDSAYILAMIYHESRFQPDSVNYRSGAKGLMQILPQWHTVRAENLGVSLDDWKGNILIGCDILNEMIQTKGSMQYAINFYAGGYDYADYYKSCNCSSTYEIALDNILESGVLEELGVM